MQMDLDITSDDTTEGSNEIVHLARVCASHSVGDTNTVDANLVNGLVDRQQVHEVGAEGVLRREPHFDTYQDVREHTT